MKILVHGVKPCQEAHCPEIDGGGGAGGGAVYPCWKIWIYPGHLSINPEVPVKEK